MPPAEAKSGWRKIRTLEELISGKLVEPSGGEEMTLRDRIGIDVGHRLRLARGVTSGPRCGASAPISPDADRAIA